MIEVTLQGTPLEVDGLDAEWLLDLAREAEVQSRIAERRKLRFAQRWAALHPATVDTGREEWGNAGRLDCAEAIGGEGTPLVAAFSAEPFAAALGVSTASALNLISAALDLTHRLPRVWALVEALEVPAWKAKLVARRTHGLSVEAAAYVDAELAPILGTRGAPTIERVVAEAIARFHPEELAEAEQVGKAAWDVQVQHPGVGEWAGTSWLDACADTLDLTKFGDMVADIARRLGEAGDPTPSSSAAPKHSGSWPTCTRARTWTSSSPPSSPQRRGSARRRSRRRVPLRRAGSRGRDLQLYVHLTAGALTNADRRARGRARPRSATVAQIETGWPGTPAAVAG